MKSVHIRDIKPETLSSLKRLARVHHRSLQGELRSILERAAAFAPPEEDPGFHLHTVVTGGKQDWSREAIYGDGGR